jgi:adenylate cyclase
MIAKHEAAEMADVLRFTQLLIDLAKGDAAKGSLIFESPLTVALNNLPFRPHRP